MNAPTAGESAATETHVYLPSDDFVRNATIAGMPAYEALCKEADTDYEGLLGPPGPGTAQLEEAVHPGARREQCAVLQMVRGRNAERLLQLPGSQRGARSG
jgi:hypothetical protein